MSEKDNRDAKQDKIKVKQWQEPKLIVLTRGNTGEWILGYCKSYPTAGGPQNEWGICGSYGHRCGNSVDDACWGVYHVCCDACGNLCKNTVSS